MDDFLKKYPAAVMYKIPPPLSVGIPNSILDNQDSREKRVAGNGLFKTRDRVYNRNAGHIAISHFIYQQEEEKKKRANMLNQAQNGSSKLLVSPIANRTVPSPSQRSQMAVTTNPMMPLSYQIPFQNTVGSVTPGTSNNVRSSVFNPAAAAFANPITPQMVLQNYPQMNFHPSAFNPQAMAMAANFSNKQQSSQQIQRRGTPSTPGKK
jgi:hypothetical protein